MKTLVFLTLVGSCCSAQTVWFEPNVGQVKGQTEWVGRSKGAYLYITGNEVVYANKTNVHMQLIGASKHARVEGLEPTGGYSNYFTGRDEKTWFTSIPHYARLRYKDVYPGIDLAYYGSGRNAEYDFIVKPGGNPDRIELAFSDPLLLDRGDLIIAGLRQHKPRVTQDGKDVTANYAIKASGRVGLSLGEYDRSRELTVDPVLEFSTYLGGPGEEHGGGVALDGAGNILIAGGTQTPATPSLNPFQQTNLIGAQPFVLKMTSDGQRVIYFSVVSSHGYDMANALAVDTAGSPVITGSTVSATFPIKNAFQDTFKASYPTGFVTKLSPDGRSLIYSSYLGGSLSDTPNAVVVDPAGNALIAGTTLSKDFPIKNAIQPIFGGGYSDCFVTRVSPAGQLLASTFLGGTQYDGCQGLALTLDGFVLLGGYTNSSDFPLKLSQQSIPHLSGSPVLVRMTSDIQNVVTSILFGAPASGAARVVAGGPRGEVWVGGAMGPSFLTTPDAIQRTTPEGNGAFLATFDSSLATIQYATYFGGGLYSSVTGVVVDSGGTVYFEGSAGSHDFPSKNPLQSWLGGGIRNDDCFLAKMASDHSLIFATPFGGSGNEFCRPLAVDPSGNAYVTGDTYSIDFPLKNAYQSAYGGGGDAFLAKISDVSVPQRSPLTALPARLNFLFTTGGPPAPPQSVSVSGGSFTASSSAPWTSASVSGSQVIISVNGASLTPGNYTASVVLSPISGVAATVDVGLTVFGPPPVLNSIDPSMVGLGATDTLVTIHGSGLVAKSLVQVDGVLWTITPVQFVDATTLQFSMPATYFSAQYTHTIAAQNPQSALSNMLSLAVGGPAPIFTATSVVNAGSFAGGPVAPGEIITIFGSNLTGNVTFDNIPATIVYSSATQISATVPYYVLGPKTSLQIGSSVPVSLDVSASAPGIFAAVSNGDGTLTLYATGCGPLTQDALPVCQLPVSATVNGESAQVLYAGMAPGLVQGANQINLAIPSDVASGPLTIVLTAGTASSRPFSYTLLMQIARRNIW